jgi:hypothetical protein
MKIENLPGSLASRLAGRDRTTVNGSFYRAAPGETGLNPLDETNRCETIRLARQNRIAAGFQPAQLDSRRIYPRRSSPARRLALLSASFVDSHQPEVWLPIPNQGRKVHSHASGNRETTQTQ